MVFSIREAIFRRQLPFVAVSFLLGLTWLGVLSWSDSNELVRAEDRPVGLSIRTQQRVKVDG